MPEFLSLIAAADIADRIEVRAHAGRAHPAKDQVGRRAMLRREEDAREVVGSFGYRAEFVDPANDLLAQGGDSAAQRLPRSLLQASHDDLWPADRFIKSFVAAFARLDSPADENRRKTKARARRMLNRVAYKADNSPNF